MSSASPSLSIPEQNKQLVVRWFEEVWNQSRRETIPELFPENGVIHDGPRQFCGPHEFERFYDALQSQFTDFKITPIVSLAEGISFVSTGPVRLATRTLRNSWRSPARPLPASKTDVSSRPGKTGTPTHVRTNYRAVDSVVLTSYRCVFACHFD